MRAVKVLTWCPQGVHPSVSPTTAYCVLAGIELITAFYGCLYAGCIPVTVRPPHAQSLTATLPTVRMIVEVSNGVGAESGAAAPLPRPLVVNTAPRAPMLLTRQQ